MKDVFVSYTTTDKKTAYALVDFLESNGVDCFIAPRDVEPGKAYASDLMHAINECKLVLLIASKAINDSEHVLNEIDVIVEKKKNLLPIFIEDFELNDDFRYYLGRKQWIIAYPEKINNFYSNILDSMQEFFPLNSQKILKSDKAEDAENELKKSKTIFEYVPERGIMINPEDHQRNVSFRTDTLTNMMGGIYESVAKLSDDKTAAEIFFSSGYSSGKNFADRINNQWDTGYSFEELKKKIDKWCQFDSAVGWGRFTADMNFNEEEGIINGKLIINEAIMVDKKNKRRVCSFIRGYCTGVLETLLGSLDVELKCVECPLDNRFKCHCVFDVSVRG